MAKKKTDGIPGGEVLPEERKETPDREACLRKAMKADMIGWCKKNGVPLEKEGEHFRHADIEGLVMNGRWWEHIGKEKGKLGRYTKGGLIQFLEEYQGIGVEEALTLALRFQDPDAVLPERKAAFRADRRKRIGFRNRIERAKAQRRGLAGKRRGRDENE